MTIFLDLVTLRNAQSDIESCTITSLTNLFEVVLTQQNRTK